MPENQKNKLRWNCEQQGCFNQKLRPKLEFLNDAFGGKIAFGDIDGVVEVNNRFLFLEWKCIGGKPAISFGQDLLYRNLSSRDGICVIVVSGSAETMEVRGVMVYQGGACGEWLKIDLAGLKNRIGAWYARAKTSKGRPREQD